MTQRITTGINDLDQALGGGLLPGTLTMIVGATGIGKTQFGIQFCQAAVPAAGEFGAIVDLSSRGDSQNHANYAQRLAAKRLTTVDLEDQSKDNPFAAGRPADVLPFLGYKGRRVLRSQMDTDQWHAWQSEMNRRTPQLFDFIYRHSIHGTRRFVLDGIEPQESVSDSVQLDLTELIYHRMLRQEHDWLAREVLRERFREFESQVYAHAYDPNLSTALALVTTRHSLLEQLLTEPLADGDLAAGANTVIYLGRVLAQGQVQRAMLIAKHRGSYSDSRTLPFEIGDSGIRLSV